MRSKLNELSLLPTGTDPHQNAALASSLLTLSCPGNSPLLSNRATSSASHPALLPSLFWGALTTNIFNWQLLGRQGGSFISTLYRWDWGAVQDLFHHLQFSFLESSLFKEQSLLASAACLYWNALCDKNLPICEMPCSRWTLVTSLFPCKDINITSASAVTWLGRWVSLSNCLMWFLKAIMVFSSSLECSSLSYTTSYSHMIEYKT